MPTVRVNPELELHYYEDDFSDPWRDAPAILLQHGFSRNGRFWYNWVPLLSREFRVLRPDLRGMGRSVMEEENYQPSLDAFAEDVLRILDDARVEKVVYVGESFGGIVGLKFAHAYPERTRALVLCNTPCRLPKRDLQRPVRRRGRLGCDHGQGHRRLVDRHHRHAAGYQGRAPELGGLVHSRDGPDSFLHRQKTARIPGYSGFQPLPEGGRRADSVTGGRGIAHFDS